MKKILLFTLTLLSHFTIVAQYSYYQDAAQAQLHDNPAAAGRDGSSQVRLSYNNTAANLLGSNSYQQGYLYYDNGIALKNNDIIGIGVGASRDVAGESEFGVTSASLSAAYHRNLSSSSTHRQYLTLGTGLSLNRQTLDDSDLRWPGQIDPDKGFCPSIPSGEETPSALYLGVDLGLTYGIYWTDGQFATIGLAYQDLNRPNTSLFAEGEVLAPSTLIASALARIQVAGRLFLEPNIRYATLKEQSLLNIGNNFGYQLSDKSSVMVGFASHDNDRYAVNVGAELQGMRAMLIYGWTAGEDSFAATAYELNLAYRIDSGR